MRAAERATPMELSEEMAAEAAEAEVAAAVGDGGIEAKTNCGCRRAAWPQSSLAAMTLRRPSSMASWYRRPRWDSTGSTTASTTPRRLRDGDRARRRLLQLSSRPEAVPPHHALAPSSRSPSPGGAAPNSGARRARRRRGPELGGAATAARRRVPRSTRRDAGDAGLRFVDEMMEATMAKGLTIAITKCATSPSPAAPPSRPPLPRRPPARSPVIRAAPPARGIGCATSYPRAF